MSFGPGVLAPGQDVMTGEFGPVVADHHLRQPATFGDDAQVADDAPTDSEVSSMHASHSRLWSSMTLSMRNRRPPATPEQDCQPPVADPSKLVPDVAHPHAYSIVLPAKRLILPCRSVDTDEPAGATMGEAVIAHQFPHCSVAIHRPGQFSPADP